MAEPQIAPAPTQNPPASGPVMDVVAPPPVANPPSDGTAGTQPAKKVSKPVPAQPPKPKAPPKQSVTAAITATVIIVLGLAALAVFAYIKTK